MVISVETRYDVCLLLFRVRDTNKMTLLTSDEYSLSSNQGVPVHGLGVMVPYSLWKNRKAVP